MKNLILVFGMLVGFAAQAGVSQNITIDVWPYVGSLGSDAKGAEEQLAEEAIKVCGSLDKVANLMDVKITFAETSAYQVNPKGKPGAQDFKAIFMLSYPRVQGTATVNCK